VGSVSYHIVWDETPIARSMVLYRLVERIERRQRRKSPWAPGKKIRILPQFLTKGRRMKKKGREKGGGKTGKKSRSKVDDANHYHLIGSLRLIEQRERKGEEEQT